MKNLIEALVQNVDAQTARNILEVAILKYPNLIEEEAEVVLGGKGEWPSEFNTSSLLPETENVPSSEGVFKVLKSLADQGKRVNAIKYHRMVYNSTLKEAKDAIDAL